jgi:hypothetical protein
MKHAFTVLLFFVIIAVSSFAQSKKMEVNFSEPIQVDSSEYFLIPQLIDNDNKDDYGKGKGYLPWGNYSEITFYNAKTKQSKKLFNGQLALINPFYVRRSYYNYNDEPTPTQPILPQHIVYLVRTENYNGDDALDTDDPLYLYISSKTGDNLKQITPKGFNVLTWTISRDKKMILVKGQNDKNGNKKFGKGDDQVYYRIDLDEDISKIQCSPIAL